MQRQPVAQIAVAVAQTSVGVAQKTVGSCQCLFFLSCATQEIIRITAQASTCKPASCCSWSRSLYRVGLGAPMARRKPKAKATAKAVKEEPKSIEEQLEDILIMLILTRPNKQSSMTSSLMLPGGCKKTSEVPGGSSRPGAADDASFFSRGG